MHEKVEELLAKHEKKLNYEDDIYYYMVMKKAGLLSEESGFYPATKQEYDETISAEDKKIENNMYFVKKPFPLDLSAEETKAVESTLPDDLLQTYRLRASGINIEKEADNTSVAADFFTILAWLLWIGGLIISIVGALSTEEYGYYRTRTVFNFLPFITSFITYIIYGCFALCAAELFKKIQTIINLLRIKGK